MVGHCGKILTVNLSSGEIRSESFDEGFTRKYLGGNGFAASLIYDRVPAGIDPFDEENALVVAVGPLTDTKIWGSSRAHLAAISPLTGFFADSNVGGNYPIAQKRAGFDAIYITGKSDAPCYLSITEDSCEIKKANAIWGLTTDETNQRLQQDHGPKAEVICIGPAGENCVLFACVLSSGTRAGVAGRCGMGAVMGSKNLKAIVAKGSRKTPVAHEDQLTAELKNLREGMRENTAVLKDVGTPFLVDMVNNHGTLAAHNATRETIDYAEKINAALLKERYITRNIACARCPVACGKLVNVDSGKYADQQIKMPEFETIYALATMNDIQEMISIINANGVCDMYGMDTISMGTTISFVAECLEKKVITEEDIGGRVAFGDGDGLVQLCIDTAMKRGVGTLLAQGSKRLADKIGGDAVNYLYCSKALEFAGHSVRGIRALSLGYATSTRGGSHHDTRPVYSAPGEDPGFDGQAAYSVRSQNYSAVGDSLILCRFVEERAFGKTHNEQILSLINCVTSGDFTIEELDKIGERIYNLERVINVRRGVSRKDDDLPWRSKNEPIPEGPAKGRYCDQKTLDQMLDEYYQLRGWTSDGIPTDEKLTELGLMR